MDLDAITYNDRVLFRYDFCSEHLTLDELKSDYNKGLVWLKRFAFQYRNESPFVVDLRKASFLRRRMRRLIQHYNLVSRWI